MATLSMKDLQTQIEELRTMIITQGLRFEFEDLSMG